MLSVFIPAERITAGLRALEMGPPGGSAPAVKNATSLSLSIHWSIQKYQVLLLVFYHLQVSQQKKLHAMQV